MVGVELGESEEPEETMADHPAAEPVAAKTDVVRGTLPRSMVFAFMRVYTDVARLIIPLTACAALESFSASGTRVRRHASSHEVAWLRDLVSAHGADTEAMSRDLKRNVWQKTPGELRRA